MKKMILMFTLFILLYILIGNTIAEGSIIPKEAIRIRIIANSNSNYDQNIKLKVKTSVEKDIYRLLIGVKNIEEARKIINKNLSIIDSDVGTTLKKENYELPYKINFGLNYFPKKNFRGITYEEGYYESIVITLGSGLGDNWWCVLFPPICMLEAEEHNDVEYTTLVKTLVNKYF